MYSFCHTKLLADAMLEVDIIAMCPVCREDIDDIYVRSLLADSVLAKSMTECPTCSLEVKRDELTEHQVISCRKGMVIL